jgi:hypothetical protein
LGWAEGESFPPLKGATLAGEAKALPDCQHPTLLIIAFSKESRPHVVDWAKTLRLDLKVPQGFCYYQVPLFSNTFWAKATKPILLEMMRRRLPQREHSKVFVPEETSEKVIDTFQVRDLKLPLIILLDRKGQVVCSHLGGVSKEAKEKFSKKIQEVRGRK